MASPKLFVSYSWSSPDHEAWVLRLATDLRESGVDVIIDKWDLKEGHDAHAFMEKMATDPEIKKVILICDNTYVNKTDERTGGVGTEAQIISPEIYKKQDQDKFVAIVTERDEHGKPYLPVYYRSRIYIDMSDPSTSADAFDQLLRWIYDQPLHKKPALGDKPAFLIEGEDTIALATSARHRRAMSAVKNNRDHAIPAVAEYFAGLSTEMEELRLDPDTDPFDDAVVQSIESFIPYRNEAIELFLALALHLDTPETRTRLHHFFEGLIPYLDHPEHVNTWREQDFDNFRFLIHELVLYAVACLIRYERFESAAYLMSSDYYVAGRSDYGHNVMIPFWVFRRFMESLRDRDRRLGLNRLSVRADLLEQRCKGIGIEFRHFMQADFVLFLRNNLDQPDERRWWPETLLYVGRHAGPFEVFARSQSADYFDRAKVLLGIDSKDALLPLLESFDKDPQRLPGWGFDAISPAHLLGFNEIATKP